MAICLSLKGCMEQKGEGHKRSISQCHLNATPFYLRCSGDFPLIFRRGSEPWPHQSLLCSQCAGLAGLPFAPWVILTSSLEPQMCDFLCLDTSPLPSHLYWVSFYLSIRLSLSSLPPWSPLERAQAAPLSSPHGFRHPEWFLWLSLQWSPPYEFLETELRSVLLTTVYMEIIYISGMVVSIEWNADKVVCKYVSVGECSISISHHCDCCYHGSVWGPSKSWGHQGL